MKKRPPHPGEDERIAVRRVRALEMRKAGATYRQIAAALSIEACTAWRDVQAEMIALRQLAVEGAEDVRELELQRLDRLWVKLEQNGLQRGDHRAVSAAVRISERRAKLLGLDAPVRVQPVAPERSLETLTDEQLRHAVADRASGVAGEQ